jgi:hypothetical protein
MKNRTTVLAAALAALACAGSARAHHSGSMFDPTPIWVKGTVVRFERKNPHSITTLEDKTEDGRVRRWVVEGPGTFEFDQRRIVEADVPKIGDVIEFCVFGYKPTAELSRLFPGVDFSNRRTQDADGSALQQVEGDVLVTSHGNKSLWGVHGSLAGCIRTRDDPRRSWLDFLNANPSARSVWCEQRRYRAQSTESARPFVEEINSSLAEPCQ